MNNRIFIAVILFVGLSVSMLVGMSTIGNYINLHSSDTHRTYHTYKMYNNMFDSIIGRHPIKSVKIPLASNGNYINNPSKRTMDLWLADCVFNPSHFNLSYYKKFSARSRF